ncbi:MAG: type VI secretion system tip protein VgrG [Neisseriaceae bacterium]|nr:type VI secretion system tip protein VgrG [Neisseriaceae bacterium]
MNRTVVAHTPLAPDTLLFKSMQGKEHISRLFCFNVILSSKDANIDCNALIGQKMTLDILTLGDTPRCLNGLITDFGYAGEDGDDQQQCLYYCTLQPSLWYLTQNVDSRIFVDKSVTDIATELLDGFGLNYQIKCNQDYRPWGFCVQYQESSFDFLNRLFEQEGIYYYFEHKEGDHTLVLVDDVSAHAPVLGNPTLRYHSRQHAAGTPSMAYIDQWQEFNSLKTKQYTVQEYNYQNAKVAMQASDSVHDFAGTQTEIYEFYAGFGDVAEAKNYSKIRSEAVNSQTKLIQASGNALTIAPGHLFHLSAHNHLAFNTEYLILSAEYTFEEAGYASSGNMGHFRIDFCCLPSNLPYRAPMYTQKPQVVGIQAATVTGPAGEEVYTNEYGDIKVQFHWDRYGERNETSSNWIRVIQGSAGSGFGSINTPRIGEEVLVDFINGDVDRPVVVGRLYNSAMNPPWGFPDAAKQSGIKSKSFNSPDANFNELMFNDTAGTELVNFQAQKDLTSLVKNDETRDVNHDRTTTIGNDETVTVVGFRTETVEKDETITINQNRTETVALDETITVNKNRKEAVALDESVSIGKNQALAVGDDQATHVGKNQALSVALDQQTSIGVNQALNVGANRNKSIGANEVSHIGAHKQETVDLTSLANVGLGQMTNIGMGYMLNVGAGWMTNVGAIESHNVGLIFSAAAGKNISLNAGKNVTISAGTKMTLQCGNAAITLEKNGNIAITGKKIVLIGSSKVELNGNKVDIN